MLLNLVIKSSYVTEPEKLQSVKDGLLKLFSAESLPESFDYKITSIGI